jgi:hypothetical protein
MRRIPAILLALFGSLFSAACGGGDDQHGAARESSDYSMMRGVGRAVDASDKEEKPLRARDQSVGVQQ